MPLYEYQCQKCGSLFEIIHKVDDPPPKACAKCGGLLNKRLSAPAIQFKGNGWYVTDYARKSLPEKTETSNPPKKESDAPAGDSSEKKASSLPPTK